MEDEYYDDMENTEVFEGEDENRENQDNWLCEKERKRRRRK